MAEHGSVEQELWNIFTFYTLHGNPMYPDLLKSSQFSKLCKQCLIMKTPEMPNGLPGAVINVVYIAEVKRRDRRFSDTQAQMTYNDFLNALMRLAEKLYHTADTIDDAFQQLLMENVLPLASRRSPDPVSTHLEDPEVLGLFEYFDDALYALYSFYASAADIKRRRNTKSTKARRKVNTMKECLGYNEFLKFAMDFNLSSNVILSTLEIGDIYLSSIKATDGQENIRKLTFTEFWEALVRCALIAYSKISDASPGDKVRGLFLYMWRAINETVPRAMASQSSLTNYMGDLISGSMQFNVKFTAMWSKDGYRDYLSPEVEAREEARDVLNRLMAGSSHQQRSTGRIGNDDGGSPAAPQLNAPPMMTPLPNSSNDTMKESELSELLARRPSIADLLYRNMQEGGIGGR